MAIDTLGIPAAYLVVASLSLWVIISARGRWWVKGLVTALAVLFGAALWSSLEPIQGWPAAVEMPERFEVKWLVTDEPDKKTGSPGHVYVWAVDLGERPAARPPFYLGLNGRGAGRREPRLYLLPYSRALHEQAEEIREILGDGKRFFATFKGDTVGREGTAAGKAGRTGSSTGGDVLEGVEGEPGAGRAPSGRPVLQDYVFHELPPPRFPDKNAP